MNALVENEFFTAAHTEEAIQPQTQTLVIIALRAVHKYRKRARSTFRVAAVTFSTTLADYSADSLHVERARRLWAFAVHATVPAVHLRCANVVAVDNNIAGVWCPTTLGYPNCHLRNKS